MIRRGMLLLLTVALALPAVGALLSVRSAAAQGQDVRVANDSGSSFQLYADLAIAGDGTLYAVWADYRNGHYPEAGDPHDAGDIYFARSTDGGLSWSANVRVNDDAAAAARRRLPRVAVAPAGDVYVVWEDYRNDPNPTNPGSTPEGNQNPDIYLAKLPAGGSSFQPNVLVYNNGDFQLTPDVEVDSNGHVYVAFYDRTGDIFYGNSVVAKSTNGGASFGAPVIADDHGPWALTPRLAVNRADNTLYLVYQGHPSGYYKPFFTRSTDGGADWSANVRLDDGTLDWYDATREIVVAADENGHVVVVWADERNDPDNCYDNNTCPSPHDEFDIYATYSGDSGASWASTNVMVNDDSTYDRMYAPSVAFAPDGTVVAMWRDSRAGDGKNDIWMGTSSDYGASWSANQRFDHGPSGSAADYPAVVVNSAGVYQAVWHDDRNGNWDIYSSAPGSVTVDLDASQAAPGVSSTNRQAIQPGTTTLHAYITNQGPSAAINTLVEFYNGHPNTGTLLGSTTITNIAPGATEKAYFNWTATHNATAELYVKASAGAGQTDTNAANDVTAQAATTRVYHPTYKYNPDTFGFKNWSMTWGDFLDDLTDLSHYVPVHIGTKTWRYVVGPHLYAFVARGGHCYGMSQASVVWWDTPSARPGGSSTIVYNLSKTQATPGIREHHARQVINVVPIAPLVDKSPSAGYADLKSRLAATEPRPAILNLLGTWKHAVTAYKIVEIGTKGYIFVYDSNFPMLTSQTTADYLTYDLNSHTMRYQNKAVTEVFVTDPLRELYEGPIQKVYQWWANQRVADKLAQVYMSFKGLFTESETRVLAAEASYLVTDQDGHRAGYHNGAVINEIAGAVVTELDGAFLIEVPAGLEYTVTATAPEDGELTLSQAIPLDDGMVQEVVYEDVGMDAAETANTDMSQSETDWTMDVGGDEVQPVVERQLDPRYHVHMPVVVRR